MKINVNFSAAGFGKIFQNSENISDETPNKETISNISEALSQVQMSIGKPIEFKSVPELIGIEYMGYIIEKERFDPKTSEWIKTDEYKIIGSNSNTFKDTRIAYGYTYRYRMKSVIKATVKRPKKDLKDFASGHNIQNLIDGLVKQSIESNKNDSIQLQKDANNGIDLKTSSGIPEKSIQISDTTKQVISGDNTIKTVSFSGKTSNLGQGSLSQEQFTKKIGEMIEQKQKIKQDFEIISVYYESNPSKDWTIVDVVKLTPPVYPQTIKIFPNSIKKEIMISWLKPVSDVEVRFYSIYRRGKIGESWKPIVEGLREFATLFVDKDVALGQKYIYAITSIDVHGIESFLSTQIQVELNPNIVTEKKERDLVWVSGGGTRLDEINLILKKFSQRKEQLIAIENIKIRPNTKFRDESKDFIIKITSLDTHEKYELKLTLKNEKLEGNE